MKKDWEGGYKGEGGCYGGGVILFFFKYTIMYVSPPFLSYYHESNAPSICSKMTAKTNGRDEWWVIWKVVFFFLFIQIHSPCTMHLKIYPFSTNSKDLMSELAWQSCKDGAIEHRHGALHIPLILGIGESICVSDRAFKVMTNLNKSVIIFLFHSFDFMPWLHWDTNWRSHFEIASDSVFVIRVSLSFQCRIEWKKVSLWKVFELHF